MLCAARTAEAAQGVTAAQGDASLGGYGLALGAGLDLADLTSVSAYVERLYQELPQGVEGALLCAGVEALPLRRTPQGFEATFAVNVLSHFVLAAELAARAGRPASSGTGGLPWASSSGGGELGEPAKVGRPCRLVSVTSSAAFDSRLGEGDALDLNCLRRAYDPRRAYVDSKACNVLLADELQRRSRRAGGSGGGSGSGSAATALVSCSADPGPTASMLLRYALPQRAAQRATMSSEQLARQARQLGLRTPSQAARGLVWCLTSPACAPGALYLGAAAAPDAPPPLPTWEAPLPWRNEALAAAVWRECAQLADPFLSPLARTFVA